MGGAVGEEVVDDHSDDGEEEDDESPDDLVDDRAVGLEDLDCGAAMLAVFFREFKDSTYSMQ